MYVSEPVARSLHMFEVVGPTKGEKKWEFNRLPEEVTPGDTNLSTNSSSLKVEYPHQRGLFEILRGIALLSFRMKRLTSQKKASAVRLLEEGSLSRFHPSECPV